MVTKETKNFKTVETLRERERESLNLNKIGFGKCAQNLCINENNNIKRIVKNASNMLKDVACNNMIHKNIKDRLACSKYEERINLLHDSLSFL